MKSSRVWPRHLESHATAHALANTLSLVLCMWRAHPTWRNVAPIDFYGRAKGMVLDKLHLRMVIDIVNGSRNGRHGASSRSPEVLS